jgi:hypothetical protein
VAYESSATKLLFDAYEKISLDSDQGKTRSDHEPRWTRSGEKHVPEVPEQNATAGPRHKARKPECGANALSPKGIKGVKNQPVDWYWQFKEKNESGDGVEDAHLICFLILYHKKDMQWRVPIIPSTSSALRRENQVYCGEPWSAPHNHPLDTSAAPRR